MRQRNFILAILVGTLAWTSAQAQDAGLAFFETRIRPLLVEHCYECHSAGAKKIRGKLLLDSRAGARAGGVTGPAVVPGNLEKSLLIQAVRFHADGLKMPPRGKLSARAIADLETWIKMGAPDPRDQGPTVKRPATWEEIVETRKRWWSLQPVANPAPPTPRRADWSRDPIDRFVLAKLEATGLAPALDADPRTLLRRLSSVLIGLPPTSAEIDAFLKDHAADPNNAVGRLVDRLLASPHFGERWARHWMDVVRFTETHGNEWNYDVHHAWRYRDYLIRAFNDDVPYDQLVREHIAGDLLPAPRWRADVSVTGKGKKARFNESILGTAFYRFGEVNHDDCIGLPSIGYDLVDNQIDTLTKAFQALTVACARCHDHKLDAISQRDYHGLLGILRSSRQVAHTIDGPEVNAGAIQAMREIKKAIRLEISEAYLRDLRRDDLDKTFAKASSAKLQIEHPLWIWSRSERESEKFADAWKQATLQFAKEDAEREGLIQRFTPFADFRQSAWPDWQVGGQGLRGVPSRAGEFVVAESGERALASILSAGAYTHAISARLNGTLRSPILGGTKKFISFQVLGENASAVRLVSNNCQLNYRNFRYLTKNELQWITLPIPENAESLRVYAEVMTKFDNPKFPDQLGTLGGDKLNYRVPWEKAAADPRSHFGITQVVLHDQPSPPKASLRHLRSLFGGGVPADRRQLARRLIDRLEAAVRAWRDDHASDDDVRWLEAFRQLGVLNDRTDVTPKLAKLVADYRKRDQALALPRVAPGFADAGAGFDQRVFHRGDCTKPGEPTPRRYVEVLAKGPIVSKGSGRLELANILAARDNPLTARVMVNRIWHHLFGAGIVRTVDDFGHVGELPSHPELLDHLANRFVNDGWSIKCLIRAIVLSRAFATAHQPSAAAVEADPENRLLQHYPARRLEAEAIRDAILSASGRLDRTLFGMSVPSYREKEYADRRLFRGPLDGAGRRSIYLKVTLMEAPRFLDVFNFPGGKVTQGRRDVTSVPAQALAMMNDPFVIQQAEAWGKRVAAEKNQTADQRLQAMFRTALGRDPGEAEAARFRQFIASAGEPTRSSTDDVLASATVWRDVAHALFNLREFITIP